MLAGLPPWALMWVVAYAIFTGCKWLTLHEALTSGVSTSGTRILAYWLTWPGMDARSFLDTRSLTTKPSAGSWMQVTVKTALGLTVLYGLARSVPAHNEMLRGWLGLVNK